MKWFNRALPLEDQKLLEEAHARLKAEAERIEQEKRLQLVLVSDPIDYASLLRIGQKVGADALEIINVNGSVVRYYFNIDNKVQIGDEAIPFEDAYGEQH